MAARYIPIGYEKDGEGITVFCPKTLSEMMYIGFLEEKMIAG